MAKHKYKKLLSRLLREIVKLSQTLTRQTWRWLWRSFFVANRRRRNQAGFVLPTVTMLLLVVALVVGAIMFRTFTRTNQVIGQGQQQVIKNAATPAIERAKAKLEYLFNDPRLQSGIPDEKVLEALLLNDTSLNFDILNTSPYRFPDETQVTPTALGVTLDAGINGVTAWKFGTDKNGDGDTSDDEDLVTYYAIVSRAERNNLSIDPAATNPVGDDQTKANNFIVRNGPLVSLTGNASSQLCQVQVGGNPVGWFNSGSAYVYKNFQVYAIALPKGVTNGKALGNVALDTLQYQQDRAFERGNKWGAWFRYDLEISPGAGLNWNGSMHTQGNMFAWTDKAGSGNLRFYLISSPSSCFFDNKSNSVLSLRSDKPTPASPNVRGGQLISGVLQQYETTKVRIDTLEQNPNPIDLTVDNQWVDKSKGTPLDVSTDRLALHTQGISEPRNNNTWGLNPSAAPELKDKRVIQTASCAPYVDDTYRADNRFGPKPTYSREIYDEATGRCEAPAEGTIGSEIATPAVSAYRVSELTRDVPESVNDKEGEKVGLDGYWERRSRFNGLRLIVGQRLELGNPFGWNVDRDSSGSAGSAGADRDLYPLTLPPSTPPNPNPDPTGYSPTWAGTTRRNEARQYTTLRDNLAAVQATAVYHYTSDSGYFPVAFVATTVHPGTAKTLQDSTVFRKPTAAFKTKTTPTASIFGADFGNDNSEILTNFFIGEGTNGWEFNVVPGATQTEAAFKTAIAANQPLRRALTNLAYFAGDPDGYFPPKQEPTSSKTVHPYPNLTMWGNFSNLRETIRRLDAGTSYDNLSIADKSNLHTAAGMLGMLAYNISYLQDYDYQLNGAPETDLDNLNKALQDSSLGSPPSTTGASQADYYIAELEKKVGSTPNTLNGIAVTQNLVNLARLVAEKEQVSRDRQFGFMGGETALTEDGCKATTGYFDANSKTGLKKLCPQDVADASKKGPKFPSLFYLFPKYSHNHLGNPPATVTVGSPAVQPTTGATGEPYVADTYIYDATNSKGANWNLNYQVLEDTNSNGVEEGTENGIAKIALQPRALADWKLPKLTNNTGVNRITDRTTNASASLNNISVPFLDDAIFDGRQMMGVRVLDVDLNLLRQNAINGDTWLPKSSIVYAFREDAVREDGIARPVINKTWGSYASDYSSNPFTASNAMNLWDAAGPKDPPQCLMDANNNCLNSPPPRGISAKPVDFYADPDRRPYGFRLRNGLDLRRVPQNADNQYSGLSFISDNPVYIQGDFNPHSGSASTSSSLEEFTQTLDLANNWSNFYTRTDLNPSFARPGTDTWRPAEIISDAVTILSSSFTDGNIQSGIRNTNVTSSYRNSLLKGDPAGIAGSATDVKGYICENPFDAKSAANAGSDRRGCDGPIKVFRNGEIKFYNAAGNATSYAASDYRSFSDIRNTTSALISAVDTTVNAVIVSGVVPSWLNQKNGGLENFPRFLESWRDKNLRFSGSLMQLSFSTYATAPWDQDAWEPPATPQTAQNQQYYWAPKRVWGYDVGLQYAPPAPVGKRMVTPAKQRTEFYRELRADDAYICKLRQAANYPCQ